MGNMSGYENVVGGKLKLKGKALNVKAACQIYRQNDLQFPGFCMTTPLSSSSQIHQSLFSSTSAPCFSPNPTLRIKPDIGAKSGGGKQKKKKWSKGKQKEKVNNMVLFDQASYDKLLFEVPKYKLITLSILSDRLRVIAATVASDLVKYTEAFLGKSNEEYCAWILDPEKWGVSKYPNFEAYKVDLPPWLCHFLKWMTHIWRATSTPLELILVVRDDIGNVKLDCPAIGKQFAAEEISAHIMPTFKSVNQLSVVYDEVMLMWYERMATKDRGRIAGLEVLHIINESTVASLA
ncbi:hypothetical protein IFM89_029708 [Coptis chinensis]|uniref:40S ribosomal protein S25 n=1 Tax=Coptis chinensis TaxID=261450 RepID=A0A835GZW2_9MAGN|nr:hypothetical protein IFM89_029708 [Coptis chinensis]